MSDYELRGPLHWHVAPDHVAVYQAGRAVIEVYLSPLQMAALASDLLSRASEAAAKLAR